MQKNQLKAILVEDETASQVALSNLIHRYCPQVHLEGTAKSIAEARDQIAIYQPQLVFLDIELSGENGFELFRYFETPAFKVIFTTAYNQYAIQALRYVALDYLLKPIDVDELVRAVQAAEKGGIQTAQLQLLRNNHQQQLQRVALPDGHGFRFVDIHHVLRCEAQGNYTMVYFTDGQSLLVSKTLRHFEELLENAPFFRINRKDLVNLKYIQSYTHHKKARVVLPGNLWLELSDTRKQEFLECFGVG